MACTQCEPISITAIVWHTLIVTLSVSQKRCVQRGMI